MTAADLKRFQQLAKAQEAARQFVEKDAVLRSEVVIDTVAAEHFHFIEKAEHADQHERERRLAGKDDATLTAHGVVS